MVLMKLLSNENGIIRYSYQPEKNGKPGILSYDKANNVPKIEILAENDGESIFYRNPAFSMILENINSLPAEKTIMWY